MFSDEPTADAPQMKFEPLVPDVPIGVAEADLAPPAANSFVFTQDTSRIYIDRALEVNKGDVVVWPDGAPDICWDAVTNSKES